MNRLDFIKAVNNFSKLERDLKSEATSGHLYNYCIVKGTELSIFYKQNLTQPQIDAVSVFVSNFSNISVIDQMYSYLGGSIDPFGESLMRRIRAENIVMGISQSGKTGEVLGFFNVKVIPGESGVFPYSLEDCFESGSFYSAIDLIDYWVRPENVGQISHLAPFITPERLLKWKQEIIEELT